MGRLVWQRLVLSVSLGGFAVGEPVADPAPAGAVVVGEPAKPPAVARMRAGFSASCLSNVDKRQADLALTIFFRHLAGEVDLHYVPKTFDTEDALADAVMANELDLIMMPTETYARLKANADLRPVLVRAAKKEVAERSVLLSSRVGGQVRPLSALQNKRILVDTGGRGEMPLLWLDELLRRENLAPRRQYFAKCEEVPRPTLALLRVFFGKADACIVKREAFRTACAQNPQIEAQLAVLADSPPCVDAVICLSGAFADSQQGLPREALRTLYRAPHGQMMLKLLDAGRFLPYEERYLRDAEALVASADAATAAELVASTPVAPPPQPPPASSGSQAAADGRKKK